MASAGDLEVEILIRAKGQTPILLCTAEVPVTVTLQEYTGDRAAVTAHLDVNVPAMQHSIARALYEAADAMTASPEAKARG